MHGSTFGGNPICAAAALAVLRTLNDDGLIRQAEMLGTSLRQGILSLNHRGVDHVRGRGLLCGIALTRPVAKAVEAAARDAGFLVNAAAPNVIRLAPPLVVTHTQVNDFVSRLPDVLDKATNASLVDTAQAFTNKPASRSTEMPP
jgi:acetylornithine/N-succinyldiaminopimelate aminotransferase